MSPPGVMDRLLMVEADPGGDFRIPEGDGDGVYSTFVGLGVDGEVRGSPFRRMNLEATTRPVPPSRVVKHVFIAFCSTAGKEGSVVGDLLQNISWILEQYV